MFHSAKVHNFWISGNFSEISWWAFKAARLLMLFSVNFWVSALNRLAVMNCH